MKWILSQMCIRMLYIFINIITGGFLQLYNWLFKYKVLLLEYLMLFLIKASYSLFYIQKIVLFMFVELTRFIFWKARILFHDFWTIMIDLINNNLSQLNPGLWL